MRHGNYMGNGYSGSLIFFAILIALIVIIVIALLSAKHKPNPDNVRILEILKERYARDEINANEYRERKMIIEDEETSGLSMLILEEKYARGEIDSKEFCSKRNEILEGK